MKHFFNILMIGLALLVSISCHEDDPVQPTGNSCDVDLGAFSLDPGSISAAPYEGKTKVVFVDSLLQELNFTLSSFLYPADSVVVNYTDPNTAIKTKYCYRVERQIYLLENDSIRTTLKIDIHIEARVVVIPGQTPPYIADHLQVATLNNSFPGLELFTDMFRKVINQRTDPFNYTFTEAVPGYTCFGRTFDQVEKGLIFLPPDRPTFIHYNGTEGVVSFRDIAGKTWRFERME